MARYTGHGDANDAKNYVRGKRLTAVDLSNWAGANFYSPYAPSMR